LPPGLARQRLRRPRVELAVLDGGDDHVVQTPGALLDEPRELDIRGRALNRASGGDECDDDQCEHEQHDE
jgi:hypothetical protein